MVKVVVEGVLNVMLGITVAGTVDVIKVINVGKIVVLPKVKRGLLLENVAAGLLELVVVVVLANVEVEETDIVVGTEVLVGIAVAKVV